MAQWQDLAKSYVVIKLVTGNVRAFVAQTAQDPRDMVARYLEFEVGMADACADAVWSTGNRAHGVGSAAQLRELISRARKEVAERGLSTEP